MSLFKNQSLLVLMGILLLNCPIVAQTGINTVNPDPNSVLDVFSTSKGVLIPRLTNGQVSNLESSIPSKGMLVYNVDKNCIQLFSGSIFECTDFTIDSWKDNNTNARVEVAYQSDGTSARTAGTEVVIKDDGKVGIGTSIPQRKLHVVGGTQLTGELNVGGSATTGGSSGTTGQILTSKGAGIAPEWKALSTVSGTIASANYIQGTTALTINSGNTADVPGVTFTYNVPAGKTQTLLFTIVGYTVRTAVVGGQSGQGVFALMQTVGGVTSKVSSAYASVGDIGDLANVPIPATLLKSVTLNPGTYTFKVQYKAWSDNQIVNFNPSGSGYVGYDGDTESMLTKMQILVYNN